MSGHYYSIGQFEVTDDFFKEGGGVDAPVKEEESSFGVKDTVPFLNVAAGVFSSWQQNEMMKDRIKHEKNLANQQAAIAQANLQAARITAQSNYKQPQKSNTGLIMGLSLVGLAGAIAVTYAIAKGD